MAHGLEELQKEIEEIDSKCKSAIHKLKVINLSAYKKQQERRRELVKLLSEQRKW